MAKYNYKKIRKTVYDLVKDASYAKANKFTETIWDYHILPVVKHSLGLGKKLNADQEILELSALLHDYAGLLNFKYYEDHHIWGAEFAGNILVELGYPLEKVGHVKECIMSHRGSVPMRKSSIEAKILASADAMSHITEPADMFYLTYYVRKYKTREGAKWLKAKLQRSWKKIMPEGREMIKEEYDHFIKMLNKAIIK